jgi:flagellin
MNTISNSSASLNTINNYNRSARAKETAGAQLSSGSRLAKPGVDPAGLAISAKMLSQIFGSDQASRNVQDGLSMLQTADGALSNIAEMTDRVNELTVQAANGIYTDDQRAMMQNEVSHMIGEINAAAGRAEFNEKKLFDGSLSAEKGGLWIQSGPNSGQGVQVSINRVAEDSLGLSGYSFADKTGEETSAMIDAAQSAKEFVTSERAKIGAHMNELTSQAASLDSASVNMSAAHSRIADTDMAKAAMNNVREDLKQNVSIMMLKKMFNHQNTMKDLLFTLNRN